MATSSPSPASSSSPTSSSPPPEVSSSPPPTTTNTSPPSAQPNADPPASSNPPPPPSNSNSPPPLTPPDSPLPPPDSSPPPSTPSPPPPPTSTSPPPSSPPPVADPPPESTPPNSNHPPPPPPNSNHSPTPSVSPPPPPPSTSTPPPKSSSTPPPPPSTPSPESPPPSTPPPKSPSTPPPESPPPSSPPSPPPPPSSIPSSAPPADSPPPSSPPNVLSPPPLPLARPPKSPPPPPPPGAPPSFLSPPPPPPSISTPSSAPPPPPANVTSSPDKAGIPVAGIAAIGVIAGLFSLALLGLLLWCLCKKKSRRRDPQPKNAGYVAPASASSDSDYNLVIKTDAAAPYVRTSSETSNLTPSSQGAAAGLGNSRSWYTYQELYEATEGFAAQNLLGEGGFGSVYKGNLPDGKVVAVKLLKFGGGRAEREFKAEVEIISRIHHRHLVSLVGYCINENRRLLVYDYVPNQTLYYHLHAQGRPALNWESRVKIAAGAARGLAYLHEDCCPRIIHRDIKSSNILLDDNFKALVADFGLAKLVLDANTHVSTRVMGTFGYMAPEYATTGKLTDKSDVFSFGVVLLELITGRKPVDESQPLGDESLVEWARPLLSDALNKGEIESLVDPRLEKNYNENEMFLMIEVAAACVRHSAAKRPRMGQIVRAFDNLFPSDLSNGMRVGESGMYNSAQQSAEIRWFRRMAFGSQDYSTDLFSEQQTQYYGFSGQGGREEGFNSEQQTQYYSFSGQGGQEEGFNSTQQNQNDSSRQQRQNAYHSSLRTQQEPIVSGQCSGHSSGQKVDTLNSGEILNK